MLILLFPHILPHLRRCAPEVLLEYPVEKAPDFDYFEYIADESRMVE